MVLINFKTRPEWRVFFAARCSLCAPRYALHAIRCSQFIHTIEDDYIKKEVLMPMPQRKREEDAMVIYPLFPTHHSSLITHFYPEQAFAYSHISTLAH
jgi:hypothetical protein